MVEKAKAAAAAAKAKLAEAAGGGKALFVKHGGGSILKILASDELQLFVIKEGPTKEILESLQKDCKNGDVDFKLTIGYFKEQVTQKKDEAESIVEERKTKLKTSFYKMLKAKKINAKAEGQWVKATNKALSSIPSPGKELVKAYVKENELNKYSKFTGIIENTYNSKKDEKRVAFNILGSLLTDTAADTNVFKANFIEDLENLGKKVINEGTKKPKTPASTTPASTFGKRKRGPSASLKRMCKKHGVRLMVKRGKTRVYKSSKVLKGECQNKLKKNFTKNKIKRSSIMPQAKRSYGRRKRRSSRSTSSRALAQAKALAKKYKYPLGAAVGAAGLYGLGKGYERFAPEGYKLRNPLYYEKGDSFSINPFTGEAGLWIKNGQKDGKMTYLFRPTLTGGIDTTGFRAAGQFSDYFPSVQSIFRPKKEEAPTSAEYGKRRRRRKKRSFGKKAKKPSAATRRMCKRLKVKMTLKRGGKRVYKSEAMLKKQCKKAMKRKSKK